MKATLIKITPEMTGNTELSEALMKNFNAINDMAEQREEAIFKGLKEMENRIINSFNESIDIKLDSKLRAELTPLKKQVSAIIKHLNIDPNLLLEN